MRGSSHLAIGLITGVAIAGLVPGHSVFAGRHCPGRLFQPRPRPRPPRKPPQQAPGLHPELRALGLRGRGAGSSRPTPTCSWRPGAEQRLYYTAALAFGLIGVGMQGGSARRLALLFTGLGTVVAGLYTEQLWLSLLGTFVALAPFTSHRSWTHTIWATALWTYIGYLADQHLGWRGVALFAGGGYASHLLADTLTKAGCTVVFAAFGLLFQNSAHQHRLGQRQRPGSGHLRGLCAAGAGPGGGAHGILAGRVLQHWANSWRQIAPLARLCYCISQLRPLASQQICW